MHVGRVDRGHLLTLHIAGAPLRVQDHDVYVAARFHAVDGSTAGVATGGTHDGDALPALSKHVIKESTHQLQRNVFECQRGSVELLEQPFVCANLNQWHHSVVTECCVRIGA